MLVRLLGSVQPRPRLPEADALRTSGALELLFTFSLARTRLWREPSLSAVCRPRDWQRARRDNRTFRARADAEVLLSMFSLFCDA